MLYFVFEMVYVTVQEGNKKSQTGKNTSYGTFKNQLGKKGQEGQWVELSGRSVWCPGREVLAKTGVLKRSKYVRDMTNEWQYCSGQILENNFHIGVNF